MKYFLGIDNGGTSTKAAIFTPEGKQLASCAVSSGAVCERPGFAERDMEKLWLDNCSVIRGVIEKAGVRPEDIAAVGLSGHGKGLYLCDKGGAPLGRGILSADTRALQTAERWKADGTEAAAFKYSLQHVMACQPSALLAWIKEHEPERFADIGLVFECKDYVRYRLTGEARAEKTDISGSGLLDLNTEAYSEQLLKLYGIEEVQGALSPLCSSDAVCGAVSAQAAAQTGLAEGTPVSGGMFDIDACALACGVTDPSRICMIAGTWSINEYPADTPVTDGSVQMNSLFCLPGKYLIEESSATSAGNSEWFVRQLLPELCEDPERSGPAASVYDIVNEWVSEIPAEDPTPVFLPFLMAGNIDPNARAAFIGLTASMGRKHMVRAVYEGIVFSHRWHYERLLASRNVLGLEAPKVVRLAGGAARSRVWVQMFADALKTPIEIIGAEETGALGAAMSAAAAAGACPSLVEASLAMARPQELVLPEEEKFAVYDSKYAAYLACCEALRPVWNRFPA